MHYQGLRRFIVQYAADGVAYQQSRHDRRLYDQIHLVVAQEIRRLRTQAGPSAPLVLFAVSLGSTVISNYVYDLQNDQAPGWGPAEAGPDLARSAGLDPGPGGTRGDPDLAVHRRQHLTAVGPTL